MLAGPADSRELEGVIEAARLGAMEPDRIAWMERVGDAVRASARRMRRHRAMGCAGSVLHCAHSSRAV
jgi:hypothetical protein